jgi:dTDP-4-amino-4,6-dideoxygalactose transaminase
MNEIQAAFGLVHLKHVDNNLQRRRDIDAVYRGGLADVPGIRFLDYHPEATLNGSYCPLFIGADYSLSRDELYELLKTRNICARRYFYPLISSFPMYRGLASALPEHLPVASAIAEQVLCLPIYPDLSADEQQFVIRTVRGE